MEKNNFSLLGLFSFLISVTISTEAYSRCGAIYDSELLSFDINANIGLAFNGAGLISSSATTVAAFQVGESPDPEVADDAFGLMVLSTTSGAIGLPSSVKSFVAKKEGKESLEKTKTILKEAKSKSGQELQTLTDEINSENILTGSVTMLEVADLVDDMDLNNEFCTNSTSQMDWTSRYGAASKVDHYNMVKCKIKAQLEANDLTNFNWWQRDYTRYYYCEGFAKAVGARIK